MGEIFYTDAAVAVVDVGIRAWLEPDYQARTGTGIGILVQDNRNQIDI